MLLYSDIIINKYILIRNTLGTLEGKGDYTQFPNANIAWMSHTETILKSRNGKSNRLEEGPLVCVKGACTVLCL